MRNFAHFLVALAASFVVAILFAHPALACSPASPAALAVVPQNGDSVLPDTAIVVVGQGLMPGDAAEVRLTDRNGDQVDVDAASFARPGLFEWLIVYRPTEALGHTAHDFFATYDEQARAEGSISTSFEVQPGEPAELVEPSVENWRTVHFRSDFVSPCESYASATRLVIGPARHGDQPLWYEVELTDTSIQKSVRAAVVPGMVEGDGSRMTREVHAPWEVGCLRITPVGADGERGPTTETCTPDGCAATDPDEAASQELWEDLSECERPEPGTGDDPTGDDPRQAGGGSSSGSACTVAQPTSRPTWPATLFLALILSAVGRHRARPTPAGH